MDQGRHNGSRAPVYGTHSDQASHRELSQYENVDFDRYSIHQIARLDLYARGHQSRSQLTSLLASLYHRWIMSRRLHDR